MTTRGSFEIQVDVVTAPDGRRMVMLQLPHGHVLVTAVDALMVASLLVEASQRLTREWST